MWSEGRNEWAAQGLTRGPGASGPGTSPDAQPGEAGARRSALQLTAPRPLRLGPPPAPARPRGVVRGT